MTPCALVQLKELALPATKREALDPDGMLPRVADAHCFDVSQVQDMIDDLALSMEDKGVAHSRLAFLPAPVTIIERRSYNGEGKFLFWSADMLVESEDRKTAAVYGMWNVGAGLHPIGYICLEGEAEITGLLRGEWAGDRNSSQSIAFRSRKAGLYAALALINTPKVIGRRQHMPHSGIQRRLAAANGTAGKVPLHAWTEIVLEVWPPKVDDSTPHEARLTGAKALHFCRQHLRVRLGKLELVSSHWRGDPAVGIKRSRYRVTPPCRRSP